MGGRLRRRRANARVLRTLEGPAPPEVELLPGALRWEARRDGLGLRALLVSTAMHALLLAAVVSWLPAERAEQARILLLRILPSPAPEPVAVPEPPTATITTERDAPERPRPRLRPRPPLARPPEPAPEPTASRPPEPEPAPARITRPAIDPVGVPRDEPSLAHARAVRPTPRPAPRAETVARPTAVPSIATLAALDASASAPRIERADRIPRPATDRAHRPAVSSLGALPAAPAADLAEPTPPAEIRTGAREPHAPVPARAGPARPAPGAGRTDLAGVPLESLAACVSDRREEALKRQVLAAVTAQEECASEAGRYRFLETRNQNAFLIRIQRAAGTSPGDRCAELENALACLRGRAGGEGDAR
jgi:hypothetical protein